MKYSARINTGRKTAVRKAEEYVTKHRLTGDDKQQSKVEYACYQFFGKSQELLAFTPQELSNFSRLPTPVCIQILKRLSQEFGTQKSKIYKHFLRSERCSMGLQRVVRASFYLPQRKVLDGFAIDNWNRSTNDVLF